MVVEHQEEGVSSLFNTPRAQKIIVALLVSLAFIIFIFLVVKVLYSPPEPSTSSVVVDVPPTAPTELEEEVPPTAPTELEEEVPPSSTIDQLLELENLPPPVARAANSTVPPAPKKESKLPSTPYWIQIGSYSSEEKANENGELARKKFNLEEAPIIQEVIVNEKRLYRLRIGPYQEKEEAERISNLIRAVDIFEGSFIVSG